MKYLIEKCENINDIILKRKLYSLILYFIKNRYGADITNYGDLPDNF